MSTSYMPELGKETAISSGHTALRDVSHSLHLLHLKLAKSCNGAGTKKNPDWVPAPELKLQSEPEQEVQLTEDFPPRWMRFSQVCSPTWHTKIMLTQHSKHKPFFPSTERHPLWYNYSISQRGASPLLADSSAPSASDLVVM